MEGVGVGLGLSVMLFIAKLLEESVISWILSDVFKKGEILAFRLELFLFSVFEFKLVSLAKEMD